MLVHAGQTLDVTHHVELIRPGAYYFICMLDVRIDSQSSTKCLEAERILVVTTHD